MLGRFATRSAVLQPLSQFQNLDARNFSAERHREMLRGVEVGGVEQGAERGSGRTGSKFRALPNQKGRLALGSKGQRQASQSAKAAI